MPMVTSAPVSSAARAAAARSRWKAAVSRMTWSAGSTSMVAPGIAPRHPADRQRDGGGGVALGGFGDDVFRRKLGSIARTAASWSWLVRIRIRSGRHEALQPVERVLQKV